MRVTVTTWHVLAVAAAILVAANEVAATGGAVRGSFTNERPSTPVVPSPVPFPDDAKSTLFLSTEPTLIPFRDGGRETSLKLKLDVALHANKRTFTVQTLSGVANHVKPSALITSAPDHAGDVTPMDVDFALLPSNLDGEAIGKSSTMYTDSGRIFKKFEIGQPGEVDIVLSSNYFNAIFGYNYDRATHTHHADGSDHEVHEYDAASIPATFSFDGIKIDGQYALDGSALEDGSESAVYLSNAVITLRPRKDHIAKGIGANLSFKLGSHKFNTRTLTVPEGSILPGKWLIDSRLFPRWKWGRFELKRSLCVQPVRVVQRRCRFRLPRFLGGFCFWWTNTSVSGRGLAFGKPNANKYWNQVDVTFKWMPWRTIVDRSGKYESLTSGAEETDLKNEVNDPDCIEVFFVERFSPSERMGGGACWNGGTAGAKIISSDENVDCGTDVTHLAHELGHALNLKHPGSGHPTRPDGSTGTLACPSGWEQDNPRRQSEENGDNASNPLLTSYLSFVGWWHTSSLPECTDSADCGTCDEHLPSEPCS